MTTVSLFHGEKPWTIAPASAELRSGIARVPFQVFVGAQGVERVIERIPG